MWLPGLVVILAPRLIGRAPVIILARRDPYSVSEEASRAEVVPLVLSRVVVVRGSCLRHCPILNAREDVPAVGHAVLDREAVRRGRCTHLPEPLSAKRRRFVQQREIFKLCVQPGVGSG